MIKVSIEVRSVAARLGVSVPAESVRRALDLVAERYPAATCRVKFPIDPEDFFVRDPAARVAMVDLPEKVAA